MNQEDLIKKFENDVKKRSWFFRLLLAIDQLFNVMIWNGSQDETISSHIGRRMAAGKAYRVERWICGFLRRLEHNHCFRAKGE